MSKDLKTPKKGWIQSKSKSDLLKYNNYFATSPNHKEIYSNRFLGN